MLVTSSQGMIARPYLRREKGRDGRARDSENGIRRDVRTESTSSVVIATDPGRWTIKEGVG